MVRLVSLLIILLCVVSSYMAETASAELLKAYVIESEPLGYRAEQGKETGIHLDYLQAIAEQAGIQLTVALAPKARVVAALKRGTIDFAIIFRSSNNDDFVQYVSKIRSVSFIAINRKGLPLKSYEDLQNSKSIGIMSNVQISKKFDKTVSAKLTPINKYESMVKMAALKRIDTAVGNSTVLSYLINKLNLADAFEPSFCSLGSQEQWLHMSKKSKHLDLIPVLQKAVENLHNEGILNSILAQHVGPIWTEIN